MQNFEFEKKFCPHCKQEKIRFVSFSLKGRVCRDCVRQLHKKEDRYKLRDPKLKWGAFDFTFKKRKSA